jgi:hypothetical protein
MHDKFVHSDMKEQQRSLTTIVFDFMNGIKVFPESDEFLGRRGFQRDSKQNFATAIGGLGNCLGLCFLQYDTVEMLRVAL